MFVLELYEVGVVLEPKNLEGQINSHNVSGFRSFYEICAKNAKFIPDSAFFLLN
jgi:hypothetical protein